MDKTSGPRKTGSPTYRPIRHEKWARFSLRLIQGRNTLRQKEIDLFRLRLTHHKSEGLRPTITAIFRELESNRELGLLAKSILIELDEKVTEVYFEAEAVFGRKLYHLSRLLILKDRADEAKSILDGKDRDESSRVFMILRRDPNPQIRQTAAAW